MHCLPVETVKRLLWALHVEHEWIPGAERLLLPAGRDLHGPELHQRNAARLEARRLVAALFPDDEVTEDG